MLLDHHQRPLRDLRVSVTDRCNYRCGYCMPHENYDWLQRDQLLTFEEITRLARVFADLGVDKIRLTGGEPMLRRDLHKLVAQLRAIPELRTLCLTTNGEWLEQQGPALRDAGLDRLTVSLDSLDPQRFEQITRRGTLAAVLKGLDKAVELGFERIKLNCVVQRGVNETEILPLAQFCTERGFELRLIEFMDVGNANAWDRSQLVTRAQMLEELGKEYQVEPLGREQKSATADRFELSPGGARVGIIASVTQPFCGHCSRARLTADGRLVTCLFASSGHDVRAVLRKGATDAELRENLAAHWRVRRDRFSEERLRALQSEDGYDPGDQRKIEMISLGG